jgi:hypothetical protein
VLWVRIVWQKPCGLGMKCRQNTRDLLKWRVQSGSRQNTLQEEEEATSSCVLQQFHQHHQSTFFPVKFLALSESASYLTSHSNFVSREKFLWDSLSFFFKELDASCIEAFSFCGGQKLS